MKKVPVDQPKKTFDFLVKNGSFTVRGLSNYLTEQKGCEKCVTICLLYLQRDPTNTMNPFTSDVYVYTYTYLSKVYMLHILIERFHTLENALFLLPGWDVDRMMYPNMSWLHAMTSWSPVISVGLNRQPEETPGNHCAWPRNSLLHNPPVKTTTCCFYANKLPVFILSYANRLLAEASTWERRQTPCSRVHEEWNTFCVPLKCLVYLLNLKG